MRDCHFDLRGPSCLRPLLAASQADHGEGVPGFGHGGAVGREDQAGEHLSRRRQWTQKRECKYLTPPPPPHPISRPPSSSSALLMRVCACVAKVQPAGGKCSPAETTVQRDHEESQGGLQDAARRGVTRTPPLCQYLSVHLIRDVLRDPMGIRSFFCVNAGFQ